MPRPVSRFSPGLPWWILMASLIFPQGHMVYSFLVQYIFGVFQAALVFCIVQMFGLCCSWVSACSVFFVYCLRLLLISLMYIFSQLFMHQFPGFIFTPPLSRHQYFCGLFRILDIVQHRRFLTEHSVHLRLLPNAQYG